MDRSSGLLTIGDFSRATSLSVKTLRHYHSVHLLDPVEIDDGNGYRYYAADQVPVAQVIRRLRELDLPVPEVQKVLATDDLTARNALIAAHLDRLERQLRETQGAVTALRGLLDSPQGQSDIVHRSVGPMTTLAISATVGRGELGTWWPLALREIEDRVVDSRLQAIGPAGGIFSTDLFLFDEGECTVFRPVDGAANAVGRVRSMVIPAADLAIITHRGSHRDADLAYGALATHVAEDAIGVEGAIREHYLVGQAETDDPTQWITEICWPIFSVAGI
ncbi:MAG: transcriptional regulator, MerR family [Ilumatobacteraceae bacterium]|nr:transcriptional regulator, MerR family [Ilumatobacteraceae bacterium]MCU1386994.1 transcriptional regulator, MerR family [Ilumatobacteraceae bacterium]